eukprot:CAMPEP_0203718848 /NCGR_PEP_ID=MMETSP0092-20131115/3032_1 /ASSEMBLY_ACC=CAM_ASM_001090 /TAXON_ID=426623 /ORGANISM="Chaetoceros affinis, Strain CCMP159" /LENGTH=599 /DNA_ID=CAMNT_0050598081 /DNA_START=204 /DNA_END=2003 /DNA_ORIENTATION=+
MKTLFKPLALLSLLGNTLPAQASAVDAATNDTQLERQLQDPGQFCFVSASVKCTIDGTNGDDCADIGRQPFGTCKKRAFTYTYEYCNLGDRNVNPVRTAPASGQIGTEATFRQQRDFPAILLGTLGPGVCRQAYVYEETDTCKPKVIASLRLEGWIEGRVDEPGYYCYAYDFLEIPFLNEGPPVRDPTPSPVPVSPADISLDMTCSYAQGDVVYNCEHISFSELEGLTSCDVDVTFTYVVVNRSGVPVRLSALLDSTFVNLANGEEIAAYTPLTIKKGKTIDICDLGGTTIKRKAYALASPVSGGIAATAMDALTIDVPYVPLALTLTGLSCQIDDNSGRECNAYLDSIKYKSQCIVDVKFTFKVMNTAIACVDIQDAEAKIGPHTSTLVPFDDVYSCDMRRICRGEVFDIPARKGVVNICNFSKLMNPWPIEFKVTDTLRRSQLFTDEIEFNSVTFGPINPEPTDPTGEKCSGRPSEIKFKIVPTKCGEDKNELKSFGRRRELSHNGDKIYYSCSDSTDARISFPAKVFISDNKGNELFSRNNVARGESFDLQNVPTNLRVKIFSKTNDQVVVFHSSCSKPIYTGDTMGSFKILEFSY